MIRGGLGSSTGTAPDYEGTTGRQAVIPSGDQDGIQKASRSSYRKSSKDTPKTHTIQTQTLEHKSRSRNIESLIHKDDKDQKPLTDTCEYKKSKKSKKSEKSQHATGNKPPTAKSGNGRLTVLNEKIRYSGVTQHIQGAKRLPMTGRVFGLLFFTGKTPAPVQRNEDRTEKEPDKQKKDKKKNKLKDKGKKEKKSAPKKAKTKEKKSTPRKSKKKGKKSTSGKTKTTEEKINSKEEPKRTRKLLEKATSTEPFEEKKGTEQTLCRVQVTGMEKNEVPTMLVKLCRKNSK